MPLQQHAFAGCSVSLMNRSYKSSPRLALRFVLNQPNLLMADSAKAWALLLYETGAPQDRAMQAIFHNLHSQEAFVMTEIKWDSQE